MNQNKDKSRVCRDLEKVSCSMKNRGMILSKRDGQVESRETAKITMINLSLWTRRKVLSRVNSFSL